MNKICVGHGWRQCCWCWVEIFEEYKADYDYEWKRKNEKHYNPVARFGGHVEFRVGRKTRRVNHSGVDEHRLFALTNGVRFKATYG